MKRADPKSAKAYTKFIGELRVITDATRKDHDRIVNWVDGHFMPDGRSSQSLAFVLPTRACKYARAKHGGCSFCTLPTDNPWSPSDELLYSLPDRCEEIFLKKKQEHPELVAAKFYTSGSFLDPWEVPLELRMNLLSRFDNLVEEVVIETRCEYVTRKQLDHLIKCIDPSKLIIAIGQESTDDEINTRANNKGHSKAQFKRAVTLLKEYGLRVKGYVLLKPIFSSEKLAISDAMKTAEDMKALGVDGISINPCYIGKGTLMEKLFKDKDYTPPWLWSVLEVTKYIKNLVGENVVVICDPVAAGNERGPRNCGSCDKTFREVLKEFSSTQQLELLETLMCDCKEVYQSVLGYEDLYNMAGNFSVSLGNWKKFTQ